jgi:cell wall assembly regulator SMI1
MTDLIKKYFHDTADNANEFNPPATDEQIAELESQLQIELPNDYKEFLKVTNGFAGTVNEFVVDFDPVDKIYQSTQDTCAEFFPWAVYIGTNGGGEMFVIDKRQTPYQFGLLPNIADENDFLPLGDTFEKFIQRLYNDTAFDKI